MTLAIERTAACARVFWVGLPLMTVPGCLCSASGVDPRGEQAWMVGHLMQSVRQMSDYGVLQRTVTYKLLMGLAGCCLAAARPQLLKVPHSSPVLLRHAAGRAQSCSDQHWLSIVTIETTLSADTEFGDFRELTWPQMLTLCDRQMLKVTVRPC